MKIWLVNPFDPLPGDPEQEGRYATLARLLAAKNHNVIWWTSGFSHRFKRPVDQQAINATCSKIGIGVRFLEVPPYYRNVGPARLWNHFLLAKHFRQASKNEPDRPDVVLASAPPPMLSQEATKFAKQHQAKTIVDVQDPWPQIFYYIVPSLFHPLLSLAIMPWRKAARNAYNTADAIIGVADEYVNLALRESGPKTITATIPLGIDLAAFEVAANQGCCREFTKPENEVWLAHAGSLNQSYDCMTLIRAFGKVQKTLKLPARLFITSRGELREKVEQLISEQKLTNVIMTGFLDYNRWAYLLSQCDIGFNATLSQTGICLPNKIFYYFAAGLAVLNTIRGQCSQIISEGHCGLDYQAGDIDSCACTIEQIVNNRDELTTMQNNSKHLARTKYDRKILYTQYVNLIEQVARQDLC